MRFVTSGTPAVTLRKNLAGLQQRFDRALSASANMAASMIRSEAANDIAQAGRFGTRWVDGLHVTVEPKSLRNMQISVSHDIAYAGIFETGGTISGKPLLWIPLSGTDAEGVRASEYGSLFSIKRPGGGRPLLFSVADKEPKYFGIESVTIPKLFHINEIVKSVMSNFRSIFEQQFRGA